MQVWWNRLGLGRVNQSPPMKNYSATRQEGMCVNALFKKYRLCFCEAGTEGSDGRGNSSAEAGFQVREDSGVHQDRQGTP